VYGAAWTLQEIATTVRDIATSGGRAIAVPTHVTQFALGPQPRVSAFCLGIRDMARHVQAQSQLDLFASPATPPQAVGAVAVSPAMVALARHLPRQIYLGTSSWTFPGWQGLVYDCVTSASVLARHGLSAYAQHHLLRTVCVDRTFYAPLPAADYATYAAAVPDDFRFVVKAHAWCTQPTRRDPSHASGRSHIPNVYFLHSGYATEHVVEPCLSGLGTKAGLILFQFSPLDVQTLGGPQHFAMRLHAFLEALPYGPVYAVELRNRQLLSPAYREVLTDLGVCHCFNIHPSMPALHEQMRVVPPETMSTLLVRWMLHPGRRYDEAKTRYQPFDRIVDDDHDNRQTIARLCQAALAAGHTSFVIANNKAEGSAPCTVFRLAEDVVQAVAGATTL
jgi:uncharacterized protein YecE (DUF72 family)